MLAWDKLRVHHLSIPIPDYERRTKRVVVAPTPVLIPLSTSTLNRP